MLQALEEDRFNQLPGGIFNKGFVRAYARFVGLDEDQTVADYLEASGDAPPVSTEIAPQEDGARENAENLRRLEASDDYPARHLPWGLFAAVLLVIALALSLWSHRRREQARQSVRPAPTAAATQLSGEASRGASGDESGAGSPSPASPATGSPTAGSTPSVQPASASSGKASSIAPKIPQDLAPQNLSAPPLPPPLPQLLANLRSSSRPAKNPGSRSPPTANLPRPNFWPPAASALSEAGKKSSSRWETPAASTFISTERSLTPEENSARSKPLLLVPRESFRMPRPRLRRLNFVSFFSSICRPPSAVQRLRAPTQCLLHSLRPIPLR